VYNVVSENCDCRSTQILQPVQRDYVPQIVTVPTGTRMVYDQQQQSTPLAVVGQAHRQTLGNLTSHGRNITEHYCSRRKITVNAYYLHRFNHILINMCVY